MPQSSETLPKRDIGALWERSSRKGVPYLSGTINGQPIILFKNGRKKEDRHPDWIIYPREPLDQPQPQKDDDIPF